MQKRSFILNPDMKRSLALIQKKVADLLRGNEIKVSEGLVVPALRLVGTDIRFTKPANYSREIMKPSYRQELTGVPSVEFTFADKAQVAALNNEIGLRLDGVGFKLAISIENEPRMFVGFGKKPYLDVSDIEDLKSRIRMLFVRVLSKNYKALQNVLKDDRDLADLYFKAINADPEINATPLDGAEFEDGESMSSPDAGLIPEAWVNFLDKTIGRSYVVTTAALPPLRVKIVSLVGAMLTVEALQDFSSKKAGLKGERYMIDLSAAPKDMDADKLFVAAMQAALKNLYQVHGRTKIKGIAMDSGSESHPGDPNEDFTTQTVADEVAKVELPVLTPTAPSLAQVVEDSSFTPKNEPNRFDLAFLKKVAKRLNNTFTSGLRAFFKPDQVLPRIDNDFSVESTHLAVLVYRSRDQDSVNTWPDFQVTIKIYKDGEDLTMVVSDAQDMKKLQQKIVAGSTPDEVDWNPLYAAISNMPTIRAAFTIPSDESMAESIYQAVSSLNQDPYLIANFERGRPDLAPYQFEVKAQLSGKVTKATITGWGVNSDPFKMEVTLVVRNGQGGILYGNYRKKIWSPTNDRMIQKYIEGVFAGELIQIFSAQVPDLRGDVDEYEDEITTVTNDQIAQNIKWDSILTDLTHYLQGDAVTKQLEVSLDSVENTVSSDPYYVTYLSCSGLDERLHCVFTIQDTQMASFQLGFENGVLTKPYEVSLKESDKNLRSYQNFFPMVKEFFTNAYDHLCAIAPATQHVASFLAMEISPADMVLTILQEQMKMKFKLNVDPKFRASNKTVSKRGGEDCIVVVTPNTFKTNEGRVLTTPSNFKYTVSVTTDTQPQIVTFTSGSSGKSVSDKNPASFYKLGMSAEGLVREDVREAFSLLSADAIVYGTSITLPELESLLSRSMGGDPVFLYDQDSVRIVPDRFESRKEYERNGWDWKNYTNDQLYPVFTTLKNYFGSTSGFVLEVLDNGYIRLSWGSNSEKIKVAKTTRTATLIRKAMGTVGKGTRTKVANNIYMRIIDKLDEKGVRYVENKSGGSITISFDGHKIQIAPSMKDWAIKLRGYATSLKNLDVDDLDYYL